jgi:TctA family transporter
MRGAVRREGTTVARFGRAGRAIGQSACVPFVVAAVSYAMLYVIGLLAGRFCPRWSQLLLARVRGSNDFIKLVVISVLFATPLAVSLLIVAAGDQLLLVGMAFLVLCAIPLCVLGLPMLRRARRDRRERERERESPV